MDSRTQERVERWDSRPFNGGYDGLSDLADSGFSGAVTAAGTWLFMLNGRVVGVVDGDIEDFENASGTRYDAPDPSLPLLCSMEERGGETRAKYYTNETPLREVDETLQSGSFTGYLVLSENVLSGDYYVVYYGGRRMAAAYIGNAERLLTDDEAFERAADEVGIYEVINVDVDVTDVPGTEAGPAGGSDAAASDPTTESTSAIDGSGSAGADADADDGAADASSASPIESIDLSGGSPIEDAEADSDDSLATSEIDLTGGPAGITTTEEADPEPSSAGITDTEIDLGPAAGSNTESTASKSIESEPSDGPIDRPEAESTDARSGDVSVDFTDADAASSAGTDASADEESPARERTEPSDAAAEQSADGAAESASSPDLAEIEAAAEELDRNDISWVEDESPSNGAGTGASDAPSAGDAAESAAAAESTASESDLDERFEEEEQWRETRSIPSIDPDHSESAARTKRASNSRSRANADRSRSASTTSTQNRTEPPQTPQEPADGNRGGREGSEASSQSRDRSSRSDRRSAGGASQERVAELSERLETLEEQRDALREKAEELEVERDELRAKNQQLASTVERLRSRIDELEADLERARDEAARAADGADGVDASTELPPQRALAQTNLFVRYDSKSQPTLKKAHEGAADRNEVAANLRLEHHTQFDAADVAVDGWPFEEFLTSTMAYRFVDWLTEMVLYEIRDTGNADGLADLYDAIPRIDRAEFGAAISLEDDDTDDVPDRVEFDVVAYDKMGNPLVCANLNDSRTPATQGMLEEMEESASAVKANYPDLAAAVVVTSSYFEPGALEIAEQATSGGLLSRGSKLSYVNLSRKAGYHLCLVESRSEGFHMNVPEL